MQFNNIWWPFATHQQTCICYSKTPFSEFMGFHSLINNRYNTETTYLRSTYTVQCNRIDAWGVLYHVYNTTPKWTLGFIGLQTKMIKKIKLETTNILITPQKYIGYYVEIGLTKFILVHPWQCTMNHFPNISCICTWRCSYGCHWFLAPSLAPGLSKDIRCHNIYKSLLKHLTTNRQLGGKRVYL